MQSEERPHTPGARGPIKCTSVGTVLRMDPKVRLAAGIAVSVHFVGVNAPTHQLTRPAVVFVWWPPTMPW